MMLCKPITCFLEIAFNADLIDLYYNLSNIYITIWNINLNVTDNNGVGSRIDVCIRIMETIINDMLESVTLLLL